MSDGFERYHRQMLLPGWGETTQQRLAGMSALIVGVGALGSASAELLVRAGVGRVVLIDRDIVELTNLQRQMLFAEADIGRPKALAAADRLRSINSNVRIEPMCEDLRGERAPDIVGGIDVIVDGTDNFETRYVLNDAAVAADIPYVYGGAVGFVGTVLTVLPGRGPCLRCLSDVMPVADATCDTAGVFGPVISLVAARQASLTLKLLAGHEVRPVLESIDTVADETRRMDASGLRDPGCRCCVERRFDALVSDERGAVALCGRNSVQVSPAGRRRIDAEDIAASLHAHGEFDARDGIVRGRFASEQGEGGEAIGLFVFGDGRAIVSGTSDVARARAVYARYLGN